MQSSLSVLRVSGNWFGRILLVFALAWGAPVRAANPTDLVRECYEGYASVTPKSLRAFKRHLKYLVPNADNHAFIPVAKDPNPGKYALFFHVENAVLKQLNDKYFKDKELSASAISLYEQILMRHLMADAKFRPDIVYSDYKTLRFAFREDSPELRAHLEAAYAAAGKEFFGALHQYPRLVKLFEFEGSAVRDPMEWHLAGVGRTADEAATAARFARYHVNKGRPEWIPIQDFHDPEVARELNFRVHQAESYRADIEKILLRMEGDNGALDRTAAGDWILSPAAIEILRKVPADTKESYADYVREGFRRRFAVELSDDDIATIQKYFHMAETFAPSIYEAQETLSLGLEYGTNGLVATDLAGQNVRNLHAMMEALAGVKRQPGEGTAVRKTLIATRLAQEQASRRFEERRAKFEAALQKAGLAGKNLKFAPEGLVFSGDDGVFYPRRDLTDPEKGTLLTLLSEQAVQADDFRVTLLPGKYADTGAAIPANQKADLITKSEGAEKALRREMELSGLPHSRLREVGFAMDLQPQANGPVKVRVFVTGKVDRALLQAARRALLKVMPKGFEAGAVEALPPLEEGPQTSNWPRKALWFVMKDNVGGDAVTLPLAA